MYYGWRAKIGLIIPVNGAAPEYEFHKYAPDGVATLTQRLLFEKVDRTGLEALGAQVEDAARLLAHAGPDLLMFGCTTGSLIKGAGYDAELCRRMEAAAGGIPSLTTSTAVLRALKALKAKKVAVATPYSAAVDEAERKFLEDNGFEVLSIRGLGYTEPNCMPATTFNQMYRLSGEVMCPEADVLFVSCTGLGVADCIPMLERDFGVPVVTSNQASLWCALRALSIRDDVGLGELFRH